MIPQPGDIVVVQHGIFEIGHAVVRVIKTGKVMWEIEQIRISHNNVLHTDLPAKRKITNFTIYKGSDIAGLLKALRARREQCIRERKEASQSYEADVLQIVGMDAIEREKA